MIKTQQGTGILIYTRKPEQDYTESLSNSIHFAYEDGTGHVQPLNQNYGILFARAAVDENNVIHEKGLKNPYLFRTKDGRFGIIAVRVDAAGKEDTESKGHILLWLSKDLITFQEYGLVKLHDEVFVSEAVCEFHEAEGLYDIHWQDNAGNFYRNTLFDLKQTADISPAKPAEQYSIEYPETNLTGIHPGNLIHIDRDMEDVIKAHWLPVCHTQLHVPESATIASADELQGIRATAVYSDGSTADKKIVWDTAEIDFKTPGVYTVKGKAVQEAYPFPLAVGYADPVILPWNNKYYYIATNDNVNDIGLFVREGDTIEALFRPGFKESVILDVDEERNFVQTFWAPEFHLIGSDLFLLFAVSGTKWGPQCHMMKLKKGGNIMKAEDWETPVPMKRADGTMLAQDGITLDMTYFKADGTSCVVWSYRKGIGTPLDTGSMLYIATVDEENPSRLTSEPQLLTRPLYGWENIQGTINNEGPYPLITEDMVYITYSGGAACGYTYALGLLCIPRGSNYLDINAWKKASTPVLSYYSSNGIYGPGHNSFFRDYDGKVMIMYHGEEKLAKFDTRCTGMHRVHFNKKGEPIFHLSREQDLNPALAEVTIKAIVK